MKAQSSLKKGMNVRCKAGGKVSRLEGMAGKIVTAKVVEVRGGIVIVMPDYRCEASAKNHNMKAAVAISAIL